MTKKMTVHYIAANGIIAAIYFVLTMISYPLAFGDVNFRLSELLVLLCYWRPDFIIGVTLGCFMSNIFSTLGAWDMLIGTACTLLSAVLVAVSPKLIFAAIWPILINAFGVGFELNWLLGSPFWPMVGSVAFGEGVVILVSYALWMILWRNKSFMTYLKPLRKLTPNW